MILYTCTWCIYTKFGIGTQSFQTLLELDGVLSNNDIVELDVTLVFVGFVVMGRDGGVGRLGRLGGAIFFWIFRGDFLVCCCPLSSTSCWSFSESDDSKRLGLLNNKQILLGCSKLNFNCNAKHMLLHVNTNLFVFLDPIFSFSSASVCRSDE